MLVMGLVVFAAVLVVAAWRWVRLVRFRSLISTANDVALLEQELASLMSRAREELPPEQLVALTAELHQIKSVEQQMGAQGANPWEARRVSLEGALQSVANHLALNECLPG